MTDKKEEYFTLPEPQQTIQDWTFVRNKTLTASECDDLWWQIQDAVGLPKVGDLADVKERYKQKIKEGNPEKSLETIAYMQYTVETVINTLVREGYISLPKNTDCKNKGDSKCLKEYL